MRRLNLGCGFDKRDGWVNADSFDDCRPDVLMDLETFPWPFDDGHFDVILMKHVLEHVGASYEMFKRVMQELYRISAPSAVIEIQVPHFRHDTYWSDPSHVRAFTPLTFKMMSRRQNDQWIAQKANYSMIAYDMGIDFEIVEAVQVYDQLWLERERMGAVSRETLRRLADEQWNVVKELHVKLRAVKSTPPS